MVINYTVDIFIVFLEYMEQFNASMHRNVELTIDDLTLHLCC